MGTHLTGKKLLVEQLVGMAIRAVAIHTSRDILARADTDAQTLEWLADEFKSLRAEERAWADLTIERVLLLDAAQRVYATGVLGNSVMSVKAAARFGVRWQVIGKDDTLAAYDRMCKHFDIVKLIEPYDLKTEGRSIQAEAEQIAGENRFLRAYMPALEKEAELSWREQTDTGALLTVIALLRYKRQRSAYPQTRQELVEAGYLKAVPQDPFGPGPLSYVTKDNDFVLYSCGPDMDDDGGVRGERGWSGEDGDAVFWPVETPEKPQTGPTGSNTGNP